MSAVSQEQSEAEGSLKDLIDVLQEIDTSSPMAKTNEQSISDNNGGRIIL